MNKKINSILANILSGILVLTVSLPVSAEMAADEVARLGVDLTPLGGEKAGNADGTIPAWDGGLTQAPSGYTEGGYYVDPFSGDGIKFTITSGNMGEHADKLTEGHKALLKTYSDSFRMNVYPPPTGQLQHHSTFMMQPNRLQALLNSLTMAMVLITLS